MEASWRPVRYRVGAIPCSTSCRRAAWTSSGEPPLHRPAARPRHPPAPGRTVPANTRARAYVEEPTAPPTTTRSRRCPSPADPPFESRAIMGRYLGTAAAATSWPALAGASRPQLPSGTGAAAPGRKVRKPTCRHPILACFGLLTSAPNRRYSTAAHGQLLHYAGLNIIRPLTRLNDRQLRQLAGRNSEDVSRSLRFVTRVSRIER